MKSLIAAALLCASFSVSADPIARHPVNGDSVQLLDKPCAADVAKVIPEQVRQFYRASVSVIGGKRYDSCWRAIQSQGVVHLLYADGDQGIAPMADFHDEPAI